MSSQLILEEKERESGYMSPEAAAALFRAQDHRDPDYCFKIFCKECNGWVNWQPGKEECPRCQWFNDEARALCESLQRSVSAEPPSKPELAPVDVDPRAMHEPAH